MKENPLQQFEADLWGVWVFPSDPSKLCAFLEETLKLKKERAIYWNGGFSETRYVAGVHRIGVIEPAEALLEVRGEKKGLPVFFKFTPCLPYELKASFSASGEEVAIYGEKNGEFMWIIIKGDTR